MDISGTAHQSASVQIASAPPVAAESVRDRPQEERNVALSSGMQQPVLTSESTEDSSVSLAPSPKKESIKKGCRLGCRRWCLACLSGCCCILGFLLIGIGIFAAKMQQRYTPIFKDVVCEEPDVDISDVNPQGIGLEFDLLVVLNCHNPNYYSLKLQAPATPGNVSLAAKSKRRLTASSSWKSSRRLRKHDDDDDDGDDDRALVRWSTSTTTSSPTTTTTSIPQSTSKGNATDVSNKSSIEASASEITRQQATENEAAREDEGTSAAKRQISGDDDDDDDGESKTLAPAVQLVKNGTNNKDGSKQKKKHNDSDDDDDDDNDDISGSNDDDDLDHLFDGIGDGDSRLGTLELIPSNIASESDGVVWLKAKVVFEGLDGIGNGIDIIFDKTNIQLDLIFDTVVEPFPGISFTVNEDEKCGVQIDAMQDKTGDLVCADSYDKLKIPPINNSAEDNEPLKLGASAKDLEDASKARDKYMGLAQTLGYSLGVACLICAMLMLSCCVLATRRDRAREPTWAEGHMDNGVANV